MEVLPFRWQGVSRVERLRALVLEQSRSWLRGWSAVAEPAVCIVDILPAQRHADSRASDRWFTIEGAMGSLWLRTSPDAIEQLGRCLAGTHASDGHGLAAGIGKRALADLAGQLARSDGPGDFELSTRPSPGTLDVRHGVAGFSCAFHSARFELFFDAGLCDALAPPATSSADLTPRAEAIRPAEITLHAVLDLGLASLEDTLVLRPGEVIKTAIALSQSVSVQSGSGETLFVGALVAHDGHRALRCTRTHLGITGTGK